MVKQPISGLIRIRSLTEFTAVSFCNIARLRKEIQRKKLKIIHSHSNHLLSTFSRSGIKNTKRRRLVHSTGNSQAHTVILELEIKARAALAHCAPTGSGASSRHISMQGIHCQEFFPMEIIRKMCRDMSILLE